MSAEITIANWTDQNAKDLNDYLYRPGYAIPHGLGTKEKACSIGAINIVLTGTLIDDIPDCMSAVIGSWILNVQDLISWHVRNSNEWKDLLVLAAGTGRCHEWECMAVLLDELWTALDKLDINLKSHSHLSSYSRIAKEVKQLELFYDKNNPYAFGETIKYIYCCIENIIGPTNTWSTLDPINVLRRMIKAW